MSCPDQNPKLACAVHGSSGLPKFVPGIKIVAKLYTGEAVEVPWEMRPLAYILSTFPDLKAYKAALAERIRPDFEKAQAIIKEMEAIPGGFRDPDLIEQLATARRAVMWGLCEMAGMSEYDFNRASYGDSEGDRLLDAIKDSARWAAPDSSGGMATDPEMAAHVFLFDIPQPVHRLLFNISTGKIAVSLVMDELDHDTAEAMLENGREVPMAILLKYPDLLARFGL